MFRFHIFNWFQLRQSTKLGCVGTIKYISVAANNQLCAMQFQNFDSLEFFSLMSPILFDSIKFWRLEYLFNSLATYLKKYLSN